MGREKYSKGREVGVKGGEQGARGREVRVKGGGQGARGREVEVKGEASRGWDPLSTPTVHCNGENTVLSTY